VSDLASTDKWISVMSELQRGGVDIYVNLRRAVLRSVTMAIYLFPLHLTDVSVTLFFSPMSPKPTQSDPSFAVRCCLLLSRLSHHAGCSLLPDVSPALLLTVVAASGLLAHFFCLVLCSDANKSL
jgi:hypothetical protein